MTDRENQLSKVITSLSGQISELEDTIKKAEDFFIDETMKANEKKNEVIKPLRVEVNGLGIEIKSINQRKKEALDRIEKETAFDEEIEIKKADDTRKRRTKKHKRLMKDL